MPSDVNIRFLGTSSQPNGSRNYSSLLVNVGQHNSVMVDCGEGTQRQLADRKIGGNDRLANVKTILVTHMHMDHVSGLVPLLATMMGPSSATASADAVSICKIVTLSFRPD